MFIGFLYLGGLIIKMIFFDIIYNIFKFIF